MIKIINGRAVIDYEKYQNIKIKKMLLQNDNFFNYVYKNKYKTEFSYIKEKKKLYIKFKTHDEALLLKINLEIFAEKSLEESLEFDFKELKQKSMIYFNNPEHIAKVTNIMMKKLNNIIDKIEF